MSIAARAMQQFVLFRRERRSRPPAVLQEAAPFQNDIDAIVDEAPPRWMRTVNHLLALVLVTMIVISSVTRIETIVRASGHLVADRPTILLQPMERSIVRELKVKAGDRVSEGSVVLVLDAGGAGAEAHGAWSPPDGMISRLIDAETGELANEWCPIKVREWFKPGSEPVSPCREHNAPPEEMWKPDEWIGDIGNKISGVFRKIFRF
jgi:hypothetical protein